MKNKLFKAIALLMVIALCLSPLTGCKDGISTDDASSFNMGGFTVVGNGESNDDTDSNTDSTPDNTVSNNNSSDNNSSNNTPAVTNKDPNKTTSLSAAEVLASMPKAKVKELKICCYADFRNTSYGNALEAFEQKTGVKVKPQIVTKDSYDSEVASLIASGNSPDLILLLRTQISSIKNLQPISNSGYNFNDTAWDKDVMEDFTFNGKTYAMSVENTPANNVCVILYNQKALKKAEMQDPYNIWKKNPKDWTWDKLWEMCGTFLSKNKNKEGYYGIGFGVADAYLRSFGCGLYGFNPKSGKFESYINSSETIKRFGILMDMQDKKYAAPTWDKNSFVMGYTLFAMTYSSALEKASTQYSQLDGNLGCVPVPTDSTTVPGFEYYAFGIPIGAKNAEVAPYFVRWTFGPDLYDMNKFYMSEKAKATVEDMLSRGDMCMISGWRWDIANALTKGGASQVKTVLDTYKGEVADLVATENAGIAQLSK